MGDSGSDLGARGTLLACAAAGGVVAALWAVRILGARGELDFFTNDLRHYYLPIYEWAYARIGRGELPVWNPYNLTGLPYLGPGQAGFFYPPHLLYLILPVTTALAVSHALHLVLAALGFVLFALRAGLAPGAAAFGAILFAGRGMLPDQVLWPNFLESTAWLPLGCIGVLDCASGRVRRGAAIVGMAGGMSLLAGSMQHATFVFYAWASLLLVLLAVERTPPRRALGAALAFGGAVLLAAGVGAVQLLPSLELAGLGAREMEALSSAHAGSPAAAKALLQRIVVGSPLSFGAVALVSAAAAVACVGRPVVVWAIAFGLLTVGFAFGNSTPLGQVYEALPGLPWFRAPTRILVLSQFSAATLAAFALDRASSSRRGGSAADWKRTVPLALAGALAVAWLARGSGFAASLALATGAAFAAVRFVGPVVAVAVFAMLAIADGMSEPWRNGRMPYSQEALAADPVHPAFHLALRDLAGEDRVAWLAASPRADLKRAPQYGLRLVDDYEAQNLRRHAEYFTWLRAGPDVTPPPRFHFKGDVLSTGSFRPEDRLRSVSEKAAERRLLDLAAVRWLVTPTAVLSHPDAAEDVRAFVRDAGLVERASPSPDFALFENPSALPRAYVTYAARPAPATPALLAILSDAAFDPLAASYVEDHPGFEAGAGTPARGKPARILLDEDRVVELEAELDRPGLVVLADAYYPGWTATVDGEPTRILATNHLYRSVVAPEGRHTIRFEYRPRTVPLGALLTLLTLLLLLKIGDVLKLFPSMRRR